MLQTSIALDKNSDQPLKRRNREIYSLYVAMVAKGFKTKEITSEIQNRYFLKSRMQVYRILKEQKQLAQNLHQHGNI